MLLFLCALLLNLAINNPISSPRYLLGTIALSVVFIVLYERRTPFEFLPTFLIGILIFAFPFLDLFRTGLDPTESVHYGENIAALLTEKADFDSFQQLLNALVYASERGLFWGEQVAGAILFWVPRDFWPDKANPSGTLLAEYQGYEFTNLSLPLWGELFLDGHIVFVVGGLFIYGIVSAYLERLSSDWDVTRPLSLGNTLFLVFASYQVFFLRGSLLATFAYFAPIALFLTVCTTSRRMHHGTHTLSRSSVVVQPPL